LDSYLLFGGKMLCGNYKELFVPDSAGSRNLGRALTWLAGDKWKDLPDGPVEIDGKTISGKISSASTKFAHERQFETHKVYIDIQMLIRGVELIQVSENEGYISITPYDSERDIEYWDGKRTHFQNIILSPSIAVVLFPWDVHKPSIAVHQKPAEVRKLVLKVALED
jgi:YhcH/YjgK/YiaL family protein